MNITHTDEYTYLGTVISEGPIKQQVLQHMKAKAGHTLKFTSFLTKNNDAPFMVKKLVWDSAVKSALYYSCETWLTSDLRSAESAYMSTLKQMLGVRITTCNDITLIETGTASPKGYILQCQAKFIHKLMEREDFNTSYVGKVIDMAIQTKCPAGRILKQIIERGQTYNYVEQSLQTVNRGGSRILIRGGPPKKNFSLASLGMNSFQITTKGCLTNTKGNNTAAQYLRLYIFHVIVANILI